MSFDKQCFISYIIPAYNAEMYIEDAINSIYQDNFEDGDELIVVNDGSTDNTKKILLRLTNKYPKLYLFNHSKNQGGGAARNTAVKSANNSLIFCLDSDNILAPNSISKLKKFLITKGGEAACFEKIQYFKNSISNLEHCWVFNKNTYTFSDYLSNTKVPGASGNYLFTKVLWHKVGGYPEDVAALDTWGFGLKCAAEGYNIDVMKRSFYYHRIGHKSYYMRSVAKNNRSIMVGKILKPYLYRLVWHDRVYLTLTPFKYSWMERLDKHPLRLIPPRE